MTAHLVSRLVRRGVEHVSQQGAHADVHQHHEGQHGSTDDSATAAEMLPLLLTGLVALLIIWSVDYTIGSVMVSLATIESPTRTAIIDRKPPPYADEPDLPADVKEHLLPAEAEADVDIEVAFIEHKPVTAKITTTMGLLTRVGGFRARWRGVGLNALYVMLLSFSSNSLARVVGFGMVGEVACFLLSSVVFCRLHMAWTHKMISQPTNEWWFRQAPSFRDCRALVLPTLVYAAAQQATLILPLGVAAALGPAGSPQDGPAGNDEVIMACSEIAPGLLLRLLAVPLTFVAVSLLVLFPASVTLTRIEAALLPEGRETIVTFDKAALLENIDLSTRSGRCALFVHAWRSFDGASRLRLIKVYAKMYLIEFTVGLVALHLAMAELFFVAGDRLPAVVKAIGRGDAGMVCAQRVTESNAA